MAIKTTIKHDRCAKSYHEEEKKVMFANAMLAIKLGNVYEFMQINKR